MVGDACRERLATMPGPRRSTSPSALVPGQRKVGGSSQGQSTHAMARTFSAQEAGG